MNVNETMHLEQQTETYNKRLKKLYELSMTLSGDPIHIFQRVSLMIGELLNVRVVCLSEIRGDELFFISVCIDGKVMTDVGHCPLSITPCATVKQTKDIRVYDHVAERFPEASFLKTHNAFSYCGFPSLDNNGDVIAITCLLDDKPHEFSQQDQELLQIFGQRIALEMERQRDLNERKRTEKELLESERKYKKLFESAGDAIFNLRVTEEGLYFDDCNSKAIAIFGCSDKNDIIGKSPADFSPPVQADGNSSLERIKKIANEALTGQPQFFEWINIKHDGTSFDAEVTVNNIDIGGNRFMQAIVRDITERKKTEKIIWEREERYRALVEDMPAMICRFLPDGTLTFVNKEYCKYFNKIAEELIYQNFFQFIPEEEKNKVRDHFMSLGKEKPMVTYEHQVIDSNGRLRWQLWSDRALFNELGEVVEYQSIGRDISDQKELEKELQRRHKLESVGTLAGGIAHDFNNLLTGVMNHLFLMRMHTQKESKAYQHLECAEKALVKSSDLTQQLLTFSKGGAPVKKAESIVDIIHETAEFALRGSNVKCEYKISGNIRPVEVDIGQISQVIQNIIINAEQAMPEGGTILMRIENAVFGSGTRMPLEEGNFVKITVHDNGSGIPEDHLQKIFDPYFTTKETGHGLGLTIAFSVIKSHGGHISVESELGHGTTFDIYLPASDKDISSEETLDSRSQIGEGRVLIMDDEEFIRSSLGEILVHMGYDVESARDGAEAVEMYKQAMTSSNPFDAVILDLTVPGGMGGEEAIKTLRVIDPNVKAIVSSGYSNNSVVADFREYGFRGILNKPYKNPEELNEILQGVITDVHE